MSNFQDHIFPYVKANRHKLILDIDHAVGIIRLEADRLWSHIVSDEPTPTTLLPLLVSLGAACQEVAEKLALVDEQGEGDDGRYEALVNRIKSEAKPVPGPQRGQFRYQWEFGGPQELS